MLQLPHVSESREVQQLLVSSSGTRFHGAQLFDDGLDSSNIMYRFRLATQRVLARVVNRVGARHSETSMIYATPRNTIRGV